MRVLHIACLGAAVVALSGCVGSDQDDLQRWMTEQRAQAHPTVPPISAPKKFTPQAYSEGAALEPFNMQRLTQALRGDATQPNRSGLIAPELLRRKEALEAFPLDAMAMVGSMNRNGKQTALVNVDKLLYQVKVGNHLGLNYGLITRITETEVDLREIVQDATGEWIERVATLQLQDKQEKTK